MFKKVFAVAAISGFLVLGGSLAASAATNDYPSEVSCTISPATLEVGDVATVSCTGMVAGATFTITVTGPGVQQGDLASIVHAATTGSASTDVVANASGAAAASFTARAAGTFSFAVTDEDGNVVGTATEVAVPEAGTAGGGATELPVTGGGISMAAVWIGVGALALGGGAVGVATVRRRQHS